MGGVVDLGSGHELTLDAYERRARRGARSRPVPLEDYLRYGRWYQRRAVPGVDQRRATRVERARGGFHVHLQDGDRLATRRVVIGTGPSGFARRPRQFAGLEAPQVQHSSELGDLGGSPGCARP